MLRRLLFILPIYLTIAAVWVFFAYHKNIQIEQRVAAAQAAVEQQKDAEKYASYKGVPTHLYIPALDLELPVVDGSYDPTSQSWVLSPDKAHFAQETLQLNTQAGLSLIYGHYNMQVFLKTDKLEKGDLIEVTTNNKLIFTYKYQDSSVVEPTNTSLFTYQGKPRLSILTCTGIWFENRRIMNFDLLSVREI